jgi:UDP-3-O-[3-hydroxymyristoyl] glucosamine N-acyltransferase
MPFTLGEIAVRFGCELRGDPDICVTHVGTLQHADGEALAFLADTKLQRYLGTTRAAAVVLDASVADACPVAALIAKNPRAMYARIAAALHPPPAVVAGVHPSASIHPDARIDPTAGIGPQVVIEADVVIGPRVFIGPASIVMRAARVGADSRLVARVTLCEAVQLGERCVLHPGSIIGSDGFGLAPEQGEWVKVPQVGSVVLGNDVEIGSNTTIDRGAIANTILEDGVKLDNLIQVGHNVRIGAHTAIAACCGISGSTTIGKHCLIAGQVGIVGHVEICDNVTITSRSMIAASILKPGVYSGGLPAQEASKFRRNIVRFRQLDDLARTIKRLSDDMGGDVDGSAGGDSEGHDEQS